MQPKSSAGFATILRLLKMLKSLSWIMLITILFGVIGYLSASGILVSGLLAAVSNFNTSLGISVSAAITAMILMAIIRSVFRYGEQLSGHYIAFRILANIRSQVFEKLKLLAPAKLDQQDQGNLITIITSDIEALEVFYAHTIAPIAIAIITSAVFLTILYLIHPLYMGLALFMYMLSGIILPNQFRSASQNDMRDYRELLAQSNSYFLDSLRGLSITFFFNDQNKRKENIHHRSHQLNQRLIAVKRHESAGFAIMDALILCSMVINFLLGYSLFNRELIDISQLIIAFIVMSTSFGAVSALSALATVLPGTLASARRVFAILDEEPMINENPGDTALSSSTIQMQDIAFAYPTRPQTILNHFDLSLKKPQITGIMGESGSGKSTILKLLMRFYDPTQGAVYIDGHALQELPTRKLRESQSLIAQESFLFNTSIEENIRMKDIHKPFADVEKAAKMASIHEFILGLPQGYATSVGELGSRLSEGEKQRIALARAFFKNSDMLFLDEPTSNLDVLNEATILNSIQQYTAEKQVILVSHRPSTMAICDEHIRIEREHKA